MGMNMMLTIGALVLLGMLFMSNNTLIRYQNQDSMDNEYTVAAYGIAQSIIDEAKLKAFDENTVAANIPDTTGLTLPANLGKDGNIEKLNGNASNPDSPDTLVTSAPFSVANPGFRSAIKFDDVDDYNGYMRVMNMARALEGDTVRVTVGYGDLNSPNTSLSTTRSFCKKMTVTVTGKYLSSPVILTYAFTY
jgi:hypothetical protein